MRRRKKDRCEHSGCKYGINYIDNKMCDVLFSTYLRCLDNRHMFISIIEKLYNYNRNEYSITKKIAKQNNSVYSANTQII